MERTTRVPSGYPGPPVLLRRAGTGGPADGPRVLLLHGLASSANVWDPAVGASAGRASHWSADLPWRGEGVPGWSHAEDTSGWLVQALEAACEAAGGVDLVVAHSYAATLLVDLLARQAEQGADPGVRYGLRGVVLVSPFYRRRPEDFDWALAAGLADTMHRTMAEGIHLAAGDRIAPDLRSAMASRVCERLGAYGWSRFLNLYLRTPWLRADLIRLPVLVLAGAADTIAPPVEGRELAASLPSATIRTIAGCGHFPMLEQTDAFMAEIEAFLVRLGLREGPPSATDPAALERVR